ncbi:MAG: hypothetical protein AB8F26_09850 [Phycisphaerales bacterium]
MSRMHEEAKTGFLATFRPLLDDRNIPARRIKRSDLTRAANADNTGVRYIAARLRHALKSETRRITFDRIVLTIFAVIAVFFATGLVNGLILPLLGVSGVGLGLLTFVAFVVLAHLGIVRFIRKGALNQLARTAVAEGVCGSCAFPLEQVPIEDDGCVICPECGAAWNHERIVQPFWESPPRQMLQTGFPLAIMPGVLPIANLFAPDDRGRYVQTPDSRLMRLLPDVKASIPKVELKRIRRGTRRIGLPWRLALAMFLSVFPALLFYVAWILFRDQEMLGFWIVLGLGLMVAIPVVLVPFGAAFNTPHQTSRVISRHGRCGSCMLPLNGAPTDQAGRVICQSCGSCWIPFLPETH